MPTILNTLLMYTQSLLLLDKNVKTGCLFYVKNFLLKAFYFNTIKLYQ